MKTQISPAKNYLYDLLKKKYHTSEVVRTQLVEMKEKIRETVAKEPRKSFVVRFKGEVMNTSFEKTLKIVSKRLFIRGEINSINTLKEQGLVEATITATLPEVESLIQHLTKPRIVVHCKKRG